MSGLFQITIRLLGSIGIALFISIFLEGTYAGLCMGNEVIFLYNDIEYTTKTNSFIHILQSIGFIHTEFISYHDGGSSYFECKYRDIEQVLPWSYVYLSIIDIFKLGSIIIILLYILFKLIKKKLT